MPFQTGDPVSDFAANFGQSLGKGVGQGVGNAIGGDQGPAISGATAAAYGTTFDGSGWAISFGGGTQIATPSANKTTAPDATPNQLGTYAGAGVAPMQAGMTGPAQWLMLGLVAVAAVRLLRKGK